MQKINVEYTDTFAGQANYSWVQRMTLEAPDGVSDRAIVRRVKKLLDMTGVRFSRREHYGDTIALWHPEGCATVLFISWEY